MAEQPEIDLGSGYTATWLMWSPDRSIPENRERYKGIFDIARSLLVITCPHDTKAGIRPDTPEVRRVFPEGPFWQLISLEPLHLEPSILIKKCGCHGFIRNGKWEPA